MRDGIIRTEVEGRNANNQFYARCKDELIFYHKKLATQKKLNRSVIFFLFYKVLPPYKYKIAW